MKKLLIILCLLTSNNLISQQATIKLIKTNFDNQFDDFDQLQFTFNNISFTGNETTDQQIDINSTGLDQGSVIYKNDTLHFSLKFKPNQTYILKPGCCCAIYDLRPEKNPKKGAVRFINQTKKKVAARVATSNDADLREQNQTPYLYAFESAMCLFKPTSLVILKEDNGEVKDISLQHFHFLHGEKIEATYQNNNNISIQLKGYLTDQEIRNFLRF